MKKMKLTSDSIMHLGNAFKENLYTIYKSNPYPNFRDINGIDMTLKIPDAKYHIRLEQIE